jgi:hypothetical protein
MEEASQVEATAQAITDIEAASTHSTGGEWRPDRISILRVVRSLRADDPMFSEDGTLLMSGSDDTR